MAAHQRAEPTRRRTTGWPLWTLATLLVGVGMIVPAVLRATADAGDPAGAGVPDVRAHTATAGAQHANQPPAQHADRPAPVDTLAGPALVAVDRLGDGWTMTSFGPLGPADRELLVRVRLAGLWEQPAGELAQQRAGSQRVKEVGAQLATDHHALDAQVRQVAAMLGVALPDEASPEQQGWVRELTGKRGDDFDRAFANLLRAAHGKVFALVANVRSGTRNELVRSFAQTGINVVMKHMTLLESTGKVDYAALPEPAAPSATTQRAAAPALGPMTGGRGVVVWILLAVALVAGVPAAIRVVRLR